MTAAATVADHTLQKDDQLIFPLSRSAVLQRGLDANGAPELTLFHGDKEITFDDPDQFGFAEMLAHQSRFAAGEAADWCAAGWPRIRTLLAELIEAGVLRRAGEADDAALFKLGHDDMPSPLPPAPAHEPRCWAHQGERLMHDLTGQALEMGYLETVVPIFRVAHMFLDGDGRQVGEANVFPANMRLDVPTQWRTCTYPGNRYQAEKPMNVTALKAMRVHWRPMMALLLRIRAAYLDRFPRARNGWTVGDLERLSTAVLALPSYLLLHGDQGVANGALHPVLSNLFRVTDGLRMTTHQMLFVPFHERMRRPDEMVSAADVLAYAERNYGFHSAGAVCAGPQFMIEEFLAVIIDGAEPKSGLPNALDPEVERAASLIEPALNYGLLGLQTFGTVFSLWPAMTRCYHTLHAGLDQWPDAQDLAAAPIRARFQRHFDQLTSGTHLASEEWRSHREAVYDDMFGQCGLGIDGAWPQPNLSARLQPCGSPEAAAARKVLHAALARQLGDAGAALDALCDPVIDFLERAQAILRLAEQVQAQTNRLLHRAPPLRPLSLADLDLHNRLMGDDQRTLPFLPDELADLFAIDIVVTATTLQIRERTLPVPH